MTKIYDVKFCQITLVSICRYWWYLC